MERHAHDPRPDWRGEIAKLGLAWLTPAGTPTWAEDAFYTLSQPDVDRLTVAAETVHMLFLATIQKVIDARHWPLIDGITPAMVEKIMADWDSEVPTVIGRMDFSYDGFNDPKLLGYRADSPGGMVEASVLQEHWRQARFPGSPSCNRLGSALTERWRDLIIGQQDDSLHVTAERHVATDIAAAQFMGICAQEAGFQVKYYSYNDTGVDTGTGLFYDNQDNQIVRAYHHYPWYAYSKEEYFQYVDPAKCWWIEPAWKLALTNKGMLPRLWDEYPFHPNLLQASKNRDDIVGDYVRKPLWGKDGANIQIGRGDKIVAETHGAFTDVGYIYQEYGECREFDGYHPVVSVWIVLDEAVAISIREDHNLITTATSRMVPHIIG